MYQRGFAFIVSMFLFTNNCICQSLPAEMEIAIQKLSKDEQFKHGILGLYVIESKTGRLVFEKNGELGLSPASCQKVITSVSAFELLGTLYRFKTFIGTDVEVNNGTLNGNLYIKGTGDPTLGSDRWPGTTEPMVLKKIVSVLQNDKIQFINGDLVCADDAFTTETVPRGWVWEDIGNYYGAGAWGLNWLENQYEVTFKTGKNINDATEIITTNPSSIKKEYRFANFVKTGGKTSGDNGYLFSAPFSQHIIARGTVPMTEKGFTISGSMPNPAATFLLSLDDCLDKNGIKISGAHWSNSGHLIDNRPTQNPKLIIDSILSPTLDLINFWFLKKSVNLFGEAFVKAIALEKKTVGSTDSGIAIIKEFWSKRGIEKSALKIIDGSGLSPANRVTAHSLVTVMQFAKSRLWFEAFYNALPEMNGIKMKDGYISGVRSYTGYIKSKTGVEYTFAFMVNNFDGSPGAVREKMWSLLDILK